MNTCVCGNIFGLLLVSKQVERVTVSEIILSDFYHILIIVLQFSRISHLLFIAFIVTQQSFLTILVLFVAFIVTQQSFLRDDKQHLSLAFLLCLFICFDSFLNYIFIMFYSCFNSCPRYVFGYALTHLLSHVFMMFYFYHVFKPVVSHVSTHVSLCSHYASTMFLLCFYYVFTMFLLFLLFLMREASYKRVCPSVCLSVRVCVCHTFLQICEVYVCDVIMYLFSHH